MALVKIVGNNLDQNLNGDAFTNTASQTIFNLGDSFSLTTNFAGRTFIDYSNELTSFVRPITLDTIGITEVQSEVLSNETKNAVLNLNRSDLNTFTKFGSAYEFLKVSVENIITNYPYSLFVNSQTSIGRNNTFGGFKYNEIENTSTFKIPTQYINNKYGFVFNFGNQSLPGDEELKNLNISYNKYVVWTKYRPSDNSHTIIGFTGDSSSRDYLMIKCVGNPFPFVTGSTSSGKFDIHLKPNATQFEEFRDQLEDFEKNIVGERNETNGFEFVLKEPFLLDDGTIRYNNKKILWNTTDGYNIDASGAKYRTFLEIVLTIGNKYDQIKTDLIARFLTPASLKTYDLTQEGKITKLLRIYGREFDQLKQFIDSLVNINKVTYDKKENLPDQIVKNLARTFGWQHFQLVNEEQLVDRILSATEAERSLSTDLTPAEVDIELWRRILINTNYFWKAKGTREAIKSMFLLIGIPEPFISITEYIYTVNGKIDPRDVTLSLEDLPSASLPYNNEGYPIAPQETPDFYFQTSGNSDSGQAYLNVFRDVGFRLNQIIDNKKSWVYSSGSTTRSHYSTRNYTIQSSDLVLNTKEVDVSLDTSRGIEYSVYRYIKDVDFPANSSGFTVPYNFVNLSLGLESPSQYQFELPTTAGPEGDVEVRFNGKLLNGPKWYDGTNVYNAVPPNPAQYSAHTDYYFTSPKVFVIPAISGSSFDLTTSGPTRDVIEATYIYKGSAGTGLSFTVKYVVVRLDPNIAGGTKLPLPDKPYGDVQLTVNGVAVTKSTEFVNGDYIVDPNNPQQLIIQNPDLISYFATNPYTQLAYISVTGSSSVAARNEVTRVDSFCSGKIFFNNSANKFVYRLNYRIVNPQSVKILIDGIALEPGTDYTVNPSNPYEVFLPPGINLGSVISTYYVVAGDDVFDPVVGPLFGLGDITEMSFLEFIEVVQKKLINATNRKVITDFKGGWYPTLLKVYTTYLQRSTLDTNNPLITNGYTFSNLYPFLSKYNAFFRKFVDQLLSSTIILKKGGLLVRNTVFTKQKFTYKRGVSFDDGGGVSTPLNYLGNDGSVFLKRPLQQGAAWSEDFICIDDPCDNLVVNNIDISYPEVTTTTTLAPYEAIMRISEISSQDDNIVDTAYSQILYELVFEEAIPPDYSVDVELNFAYFFENNNPANTYASSFGEVVIRRNGVSIYENTENNNALDFKAFSSKATITINSGDVISIRLYNSASAGYVGATANSVTEMTPAVLGVDPNGSISFITPSVVFNQAESTYQI